MGLGAIYTVAEAVNRLPRGAATRDEWTSWIYEKRLARLGPAGIDVVAWMDVVDALRGVEVHGGSVAGELPTIGIDPSELADL